MNRGPQTRLFERNHGIIELRKQELSHPEIAKIIGCSPSTVGNVLRKAGICGKSESGKKYAGLLPEEKHDLYVSSIEKVQQQVSDWSDGHYEYVSGYTRCDCKVLIRCKECGAEIERSFQTIRHKGNHADTCPVCKANWEAEEKAKRKREREQIKEERARLKEEQKQTVVCAICGTEFKSARSRAKYCSDDCRRVQNSRYATARKDNRISSDKTIDKNINLTSLFFRDNGVCYLCGEFCDWNDYTVRIGSDGRPVKIAGDMYPSIEHVIPISKGGYHSWDNVRLACRGCNSKKSDKVPSKRALPQWVQLSLFPSDAPVQFF